MSMLALDKRSSNITNDSSTLMPYGISVLDRPSTPETVYPGDRRFEMASVVDRKGSESGKLVGVACSSSSSSSIGENSDEVAADGGSCCKADEEGEEEVESPLRRNEQREKRDHSFGDLDALHESLPFRKGISRFYNGKSKSFATLADATAVASIKEVVKPEDAYSRRKRNLLAYTLLYESNNSHQHQRGGRGEGRGASSLLKNCQRGGISKRPAINSTRSTLALAVTNATSPCSNPDWGAESRSIDPEVTSWGNFSPSQVSGGVSGDCRNIASLSPLVQKNMHPWRSYSVMDLQHCGAANATGGGGGAAAAFTCGSCLSPNSTLNDHKKSDQVS